ncbi:MAG: caspase family protein [bacterium]|nr:caspase family protein [bacterium]
MALNPNDYALVIGIDDYPEHESLQGAIRDAESMDAWLREAGGLEPAHCRKVLSQSSPPLPYQQQVDMEIARIYKESVENGGRRFYFYFSGHGLGTAIDDTALCLAGWSGLFRNLALSSRAYLNLIMHSGLFTEVIFLLDCCRNRLINQKGLAPSLGWVKPDREAGKCTQFIAYAAEFQDSSHEGMVENEPGNIRGYFTRVLLSGLKGAAARTDGRITPASLHKYLVAETPRLAKKNNLRQEAKVINGFAPKTNVFFGTAVPTTGKCAITFTSKRTGTVKLVDGDDHKVKEEVAPTGDWELVLECGSYFLVDETTDDEKGFRIRPGEEQKNVRF